MIDSCVFELSDIIAAFACSSDVRAYEPGGCDCDVCVCVQMVLVRKNRHRENFCVCVVMVAFQCTHLVIAV